MKNHDKDPIQEALAKSAEERSSPKSILLKQQVVDGILKQNLAKKILGIKSYSGFQRDPQQLNRAKDHRHWIAHTLSDQEEKEFYDKYGISYLYLRYKVNEKIKNGEA